MSRLDDRAGEALELCRQVAWGQFLKYAWEQTEARKEFEEQRGRPLLSYPKSLMEALVDQACGSEAVRDADLKEFIEWVTIHHWGIENAPESYRKHLRSKGSLK